MTEEKKRWSIHKARPTNKLHFKRIFLPRMSNGSWHVYHALAAVLCATVFVASTGAGHAHAQATNTNATNATAAPPAPVPTYRCPDGSVSFGAQNCSCLQAASLVSVDATFNQDLTSVSVALPFDAVAIVNYSSALCGSASLAGLVTYQWTLLANPSGATVAVSNTSQLVVPKKTLYSPTYQLVLSATDVFNVSTTRTWVLTSYTPDPVITFALGQRVRAWNRNPLVINATIVDSANVSATYKWYCEIQSGAQCPSLNDTQAGRLTIPANSSVGVYTITLEYRPYSAAYIEVALVDAAVPQARIVAVGTPLAVQSASGVSLLAPGQLVYFSGTYSGFTGAVTYQWFLQQMEVYPSVSILVSSNASYTLNASVLTPSPVERYPNQNYVATKVWLVVTSVDNTTLYSDTWLRYAVLSDVGLSVTAATCPQAPCVALTDPMTVTASSSVAGRLATLKLATEVRLLWSTAGNASDPTKTLPATPSSSSRFVLAATTPLPQSGSAISVTAQLWLSGVLAGTSAPVVVPVAQPNLTAIAEAQISSTQTITDPSQAVSVLSTMGIILTSGQASGSVTAAVASAAVDFVASTFGSGGMSTLSSDQKTSLVAVIGAAMSRAVFGSDDVKANASKSMAAVLTALFTSTAMDSTSAAAALSTITALDSSTVGGVISSLATALASNPSQPLGEVSLQAGDIAVKVVRSTMFSFNQGTSVTVDGGRSVTTPQGMMDALSLTTSDVVGVATTTSPSNVYAAASTSQGSAVTPAGDVVSLDFTAGESPLPVSGLPSPIKLVLGVFPGAECRYFDKTSGIWSTDGVTTETSADGTVTCWVTHCTPFAPVAAATGTSSSWCDYKCGAAIGGTIGGVVFVALLIATARYLVVIARKNQAAHEPPSASPQKSDV